jgi:hypothetical protein
MNERIRELAEQAWKEILDETNIDGDISTMFSADEVVTFEQKFAELIVKECADWIDRQDESRCPYGIDLLEHFGVEE